MRYYDISLAISPELPVWPGDPGIELDRVSKLEEGANANVSRMNMGAHTGTHVDAPYHFLAKGAPVDKLDLQTLMGRASVVDMTGVAKVIDVEAVQAASIPRGTKRVLLKTRNSSFWRSKVRQFRTDFVGVDATAAEWLVGQGVILVGVDYLSVAPYKNSRPTHEVLLKNNVVVVEGLNLSGVDPGRYMLYCLPLKLKGSDGAPARVILVGE